MSDIKTLEELMILEQALTRMFDSDYRVAMALLDEIRQLNKQRSSNKT